MSGVLIYPAHQVEMGLTSRGLYESFYFRGNQVGQGPSFWLKHNLLRFKKSTAVRMEVTMIGFPQGGGSPRVLGKFIEVLDSPGLDWDELSFSFGDELAFSIGRDALSGLIGSAEGSVSWDLRLSRSDEVYYHFAHPWLYRGPFPKKKILTRDTFVRFEGEITWAGPASEKWTGSFVGMNGHNWGTEHAHCYAYADCNEWNDGRVAFFDGFSAKIKVASLVSPFLSLCSLRTERGWFHFNKLRAAYRPQVKRLTRQSWDVVFENEDFFLGVALEGEGSAWASLRYLHPNRKESVVENTKAARGSLTLIEKRSGKIVDQLSSDRFELETLLPAGFSRG